MARDPEVPDDGECSEQSGSTGGVGGNDVLLDRRSYLKFAGATAAAATVTGVASAGDDDYDVVQARGQTIWLENETYENKLIDVSNGNGITLYCQGNVTVRNVGFRGLYRGDGFVVSINSSGTVAFENVYIGDGATKEGESFVHGPGAVFYHRDSNADVTFDRCNVQGWPNNAFYLSNTASGGRVTFRNCYGKNNGVTTFRCSNGDRIENCVAYNDSTDYGPGWGGYTEDSGRPVWVWGGGGGAATVEDSNFHAGGYPAAILTHSGGRVQMNGGAFAGGTQGSVSTTGVGSSPDLSVPEGCPTSAVEAASGGSSVGVSPGSTRGDHDELGHTYEFVAGDEPTDYYFEVEEGPIEPSTYNDATIEDEYTWVSDDGTRAAGRVVDGRHAWEFDTLLVDVTVDGPADAVVDDRPSNLDRYPLAGATGDDWKGDMPWQEAEKHRLLIDSVGIPGRTRYEFQVSGDVVPSNYGGASINDDTTVDDGHVTGSLAGWRDAFAFTGDLESLSIDGTARVELDGERIDPTEYGEDLSHVLTIVGDGSPATYEVGVGDRIEAITWDGSSTDATVRDDRTVEGTIETGYQRFRYAGSITDLEFSSGSAHVYADRDRVSPGDF